MRKETIFKPLPKELIQAEITALSIKRLVVSRDKYDVYIVSANEISHVLKEIGRLRELTFRAINEGTGKKIDLDEYDQHYLQLFLWDREAQQIVGGYRIGTGDVITKKIGINGLYISSLFFIKKKFHKFMKQAVELGRSYIIPAYQKERLPLFLMWKAILFFINENKQYNYVYGPVSISKNYTDTSRGLIVSFVKKHLYDKKMAKLLTAKTPFHTPKLDKNTKDFLKNSNGEINDLDEFLYQLQPEMRNIPILMKQYIKQNAKFIGFNLDPNFSDALDGFMILDIRHLPEKTIEMLTKEKE